MYKIGDFSKLTQVSVRMLRHYDKLGLLEPSHVDKWSGYRYYTIEQVPLLNRIVALNGLGLTLQQITELLQQPDDLSAERLRGMLIMRQAAIEKELAITQMQLAGVEARLVQIEQEGRPSPYAVVVRALAPLPVAALRQTVPTIAEMGDYCETVYAQLYGQLQAMQILPLAPEVTLYHSEEYVETELDVEMAVAVDDAVVDEDPRHEMLQFHRLPAAEQAAVVTFTGQFQEVGPAALSLLTWLGQQELMPAGPMREVHLSGPAHVVDGEDEPAVIEIQIPFTRA
ncbi:MAG: MerR family transcriptional regulator [Caldilineaceae bacterium]|nr:MerR family transcriptional regulator [Caldilineaceae bacterium]